MHSICDVCRKYRKITYVMETPDRFVDATKYYCFKCTEVRNTNRARSKNRASR